MDATQISLIWDNQSGNDGWFVRITREDGQEIDTWHPSSWGIKDREIAREDAKNIIREALQWEGLEAEGRVVADALDEWQERYGYALVKEE